jgi:2-isopropylmalate synthase
MTQPTIQLYDATLRDGMQGEGMSLTAEEKVRVAHELDALGIDIIEAGFPSSNPKELELFERLSRETFAHAQVAAFGMTSRRGVKPEQDEGLRTLVDCFTPLVTIVGKTWDLHLEKVVKVGREENLVMISESIEFLMREGKRIIYDAEHFFDAYRSDASYAMRCLRAAASAGAERIVLCDTNGSSLPHQIGSATAEVMAALGGAVAVGIHCHNDLECGVANTLAAVLNGATQVQGTMNGIGERTGNANLVSVIGNLQTKLGYPVLTDAQLMRLTPTAHVIDELLNVAPDPNQPFVGRNAFAHKGGLHVAGIRADATTFEHMVPESVGNERALLVSELAGRQTIVEKAQEAGIELDEAACARVIDQVKELEHQGFQFEAADASLTLLLRKEAGEYEQLFTLESWRTIVEQDAAGRVSCEATIKIDIDGERFVRTAEGNGPVNALDAALRSAIGEVHPHLNDVELVNYKVRILDEHHGTTATTRVLIDSSDGQHTWGTIGVAPNVIAASWQALVDSLEYAEQTEGSSGGSRSGRELAQGLVRAPGEG